MLAEGAGFLVSVSIYRICVYGFFSCGNKSYFLWNKILTYPEVLSILCIKVAQSGVEWFLLISGFYSILLKGPVMNDGEV